MQDDKRQRTRDMLRREFGIESAFVRVPELARVLGLAPCSIYGAMRRGTFFIPHKLLLTSPAVKLDDLVDWYCADPLGVRAAGPAPGTPDEIDARLARSARARDDTTWSEIRRSVGAPRKARARSVRLS